MIIISKRMKQRRKLRRAVRGKLIYVRFAKVNVAKLLRAQPGAIDVWEELI